MISIKIHKKGLDPVNLFKRIEHLINKRLPKHTADAFKNLIIRNIEQNKYGFVLSNRWTRRKIRKGWDLRPFIAEGYYKRSIIVYQHKGHLSVGFRKTKKHPRSKLTIAQIANILEYGVMDRTIPPRPLWRNTTDEFFKEFPKELKRYLEKELRLK